MRRIALGLPLVALPLTTGISACGPCPERVSTLRGTGDGAVPLITDGGLNRSCEEICREELSDLSSLSSCQFVGEGGNDVECTYTPYCPGGRRPEGLAVQAVDRSNAVGAWLAELAAVEAASVPAFAQLGRELLDHAAPRALIGGSDRAARDEVRHARHVAWLADRYDAPPAAARHTASPTRRFESVAMDNAVEGCAREAFGALLAAHQAAATRDPAVAAVFEGIARDEARHALLSFAVADWASDRLTARARRRIDDARRAELDSLASGYEADPDPALRGALGLPDAERAQDLVRALA